MKRIIFVAFVLTSCSDIQQPIVPKSNKIVGCVCQDGTTQVYRTDLIVELNRLTQFPCGSNGGVKEYIYK